jgi:hypothetical protein
MESILLPSKDIDPQYESVQVLTDEGKVIVGLRMNETALDLSRPVTNTISSYRN